MARYIDADKLIEMYERSAEDDWNKKTAPSSWAEAFERAIADIDDQPTADVVPRAELAVTSFQQSAEIYVLKAKLESCNAVIKTLGDISEHLAQMTAKVAKARADVAREVFEEIMVAWDESYGVGEVFFEDIAKLKKKYTEGEK